MIDSDKIPHSDTFYGFSCDACHEDPSKRDARLHKDADIFVESLKANVTQLSANIPPVIKAHIPPWLSDQYILNGYRAETTFKSLVYSIFWMHNETINVWSHLFGFFFMGYMGITTVARVTEEGASYSDIVAFTIFFTCATLCFLMSSIYHWFNIHSQEVYKILIGFDMAGIFLMIYGSLHSALHFSMSCESLYEIRLGYQIAFAVVCLAGVVFSFFPKFDNPSIKITFFLLAGLLGIVPILYIISVFGLSYSIDWWVLLSIYGTGVLLYSCRFPEKNFPGRFQIYFSSHQLWHMMVFWAAYYHHSTLLAMYESTRQEFCYFVDDFSSKPYLCESL